MAVSQKIMTYKLLHRERPCANYIHLFAYNAGNHTDEVNVTINTCLQKYYKNTLRLRNIAESMRWEEEHLAGSFAKLREELRVRGSTSKLRDLTDKLLAGNPREDNNASDELGVAPEDLATLVTKEWKNNFSVNANKKKIRSTVHC